MLVDKNIKIRVNGRNAKYYENLGYIIPKRVNKQGKEVYDMSNFIEVSIFDIQKQSNIKVEVICDYCNEIYISSLDNRYKYFDNGLIKKDCCLKCQQLKREESNLLKHGVENPMQVEEFKDNLKNSLLEKYGVDHPMKIDGVKEKIKQTFIEKYGVDNPMKNEDVKSKTKETNILKYGVENPMHIEEFKDKMKATNIEKYGFENAMQSEEIKERVRVTNLEKYGVEWTLQSEEVRKKAAMSYYLNGSQQCSKQQDYIYNIVGGELNYPIDKINLDIAFPDEKIYIEYNGGGHDLSVKIGDLTEKEFQIKEIKRYKFLKNLGWKQIKIVSPKDYVLKEEELLMCVNNAKNELLNNEISHVNIIWDKNNYEDNLIKL